jgi:hypothetical protein
VIFPRLYIASDICHPTNVWRIIRNLTRKFYCFFGYLDFQVYCFIKEGSLPVAMNKLSHKSCSPLQKFCWNSLWEICDLLGYYAALTSSSVATFRAFLTLDDRTDQLSRNAGTELPLRSACYSRRAQISCTSRQKPEFTHRYGRLPKLVWRSDILPCWFKSRPKYRTKIN